MPAWAADVYPDKPVSFIVGFSPGGGSDTVARLIAERLTNRWGQSVVEAPRDREGPLHRW
jgi:tripartite-type tricarboxylate transporter receptor subunit TctC